ncbi:MAG: TIGR03663 family protein, partial [Candidatus Hydrogenedentes bacterium]|nr:TIGR03663 family protein [Candidatus Hydrogenedentota bacterium]
YLCLPVDWIYGETDFAETKDWSFRLVPLMFGAGVILLLIPIRATLGTATVVTAAVLTAVSPAMVFYSRYFIQEMLLVCFVFGVIVCGWRYVMTRSIGWAVATGILAGLAHASKETCLIAFAGMIFAAIPTAILYNRFDAPNRIVEKPQRYRIHHAVACALAAVAVSILFYSSFFTHPRGVVDSVLTYANYFQKADSSHIHDKPWYYYLHLLAYTHRTPKPVFSEGLILGLGLLGIIAALLGLRRERSSRTYFLVFLALYTVFVAAVYSYIPYKTPWNALNFLQPLIVLAGAGAVWLFNALRYRLLRAVAVLALAAGMAQLSAQAYRAAYVFDADVRNPYVYAHTSSAFMQMVQRVEDIAAISPEGRDMLIRVISPNGDYWPLPWYLRRFTRVGYWTTIPEEADASVILAPAKIKAAIDPHLKREYQVDTKSLRPGVLWVTEIRSDLWDRFMETRQ